MARPHNLQVAIIVLVAIAGILTLQRAHGQAMPAAAAGALADTGTTKAPGKQGAKSASIGSSRWTAGSTSFASPDKGAWGGGHSFSSTPKTAWTPGSAAFSQGAIQTAGASRTRPSLPAPEGATSTDAVTISSIGPLQSIGSPQSDRGSRQFGASAHRSTVSAHRFGTPLQGKSGGMPAHGISVQRHSFAATRPGGARRMQGSQSGSVSAGQRGTTGLGDRHQALSSGLEHPRLGDGVGKTGSGLDSNPWEPQAHPERSMPQ